MWESYGMLLATTNIITASDDELDKLIVEAEKEKARRRNIERINDRLCRVLREAESLDLKLMTEDGKFIDSKLVFQYVFPCKLT